MTQHTCLVCSRGGLEAHFDVLLKCPACGFVTTPPQPALDLTSLYDTTYFAGNEYLDYRSDEAFFKKNFRKRLNGILQRRSAGRLLEIGAAYGFFLDLAQHHFDVVGYEVNEEAAAWGRDCFGLDIRTSNFLDATPDTFNGPVDITVMWDVIEHLERPDRFIAHMAELSASDALLYITTGDIGSRLARLRGPKWRMIHPPTHLHYFDRQTITQLLANHGFHVVEIRPIGVTRSFRQILYSIFVLGLKAHSSYDRLHKWTPPTWGITINTFDIMQVVAKKKA